MAIWVDIVAGIVLAYNALQGLTTGLVRSFLGSVAIAAASYLAWQHSEWGGVLIDWWLPPQALPAILAKPLAVWVVAFFAINTLGVLLRVAISFTPLVIVDRVGGAVMGALNGVMILVLPLLLIASFPLLQQIPGLQGILAHSISAQLLAPLAQLLGTTLPQ